MKSNQSFGSCCVVVWLAIAFSSVSIAQDKYGRNYDEANVGTYTLPDPLLKKGGGKIEDAESWNRVRRPEILRDYQYLRFADRHFDRR